MDIRKTSLQVKANLKNKEDRVVDQKDLCLEYFDLKNNRWTKLLDGLEVSEGKLETTIKLASLEKTNRMSFTMLAKVFSGNTIPSIRLIDGRTMNNDWVVVYSLFPVVHILEETLVLDFGNLWLLDDSINRHIKGVHPNVEFAISAFPRPNGNHALFSSFRFALMNADKLVDFNPEKFEVKLIPIGEEDDLSQKIEELERENDLLKAKLDKLSKADDNGEGTSKEEYEKLPDKTAGKITEARPAQDVYTTIVDEVKNASVKLENTPYSLANVSLNLKTHVLSDKDGFKLQLIDAEAAKNTGEGTISEVKIDIGTKGNQTKGGDKLSAPNIIGLTETAARQRLRSFGLKMKVIYQTSKTKTIGHAFRQKPAPGDDINSGDTVITIFAKHSEKFN